MNEITEPSPAWRGVKHLLWMSIPIASLATFASALGVLSDAPYARETAHWAAQGAGQDAVNLIVIYPIFLLAALRASEGSLRAYLVWLGLLVYTTYSYALYAGYVHFGSLFPVYVAIFGLSAFTLTAGVYSLDFDRVRRVFDERTPVRTTAGLLVFVALAFYALELGAVFAAIDAGVVPPGVLDAGLPVDPVHVLDLGLLLPALLVTGALLMRRRAIAFCTAVPLLIHLAALGAAIAGMTFAMVTRGLNVTGSMILVFAAVSVANAWCAAVFLRGVRFDAVLPDLLRKQIG